MTTTKKRYKWGGQMLSKHIDPKRAVAEINEIQEKHGNVTPELLIEAARIKTSSMHDYFEWDDKKAAARYRMRQASALLSNLHVEVLHDGEPKEIRVFELVSKGEGRPKGDGDNPNPAQYKNYKTLTEDDLTRVKMYAMSDLIRVRKRLAYYASDTGEVVVLLTAAMHELDPEWIDSEVQEEKQQ